MLTIYRQLFGNNIFNKSYTKDENRKTKRTYIINKDVIGTKIILIKIPPWDRKNLYQYVKKERYLIRKGTNKFALKPEELKKLSKGEYIS